ncbi:ankyrin repeat protein, putative [Trichomonas vaginalis G3]|uniref:Ankyrin repeat protein, putative n=1 Tax=Trichomonas vaginalis (strain ATCC PRA-98 / G3) TaxID=412133 RepID=A2E163_TRIV3|nr:spectrin binding [Trichomonas vaginalis G3]EAY13564.1 ankyrin repeat protein, putative [Trichomonas vaginalis G3]KAI5486392.1 spectrin binding [Trichomonas vaginalis G3]|eukprot:XP_001325787.1 ankyrin repeat protein [Trichomonas vaginalis G3]
MNYPDRLQEILVERIAMNDSEKLRKAIEANQKFLTVDYYNLRPNQSQKDTIQDLVLLNVPTQQLTLLHVAAYYDSLECIIALIELGLDVDVKTRDGYTPLMYACASGSYESALYLLENKADFKLLPNERLHSCLYLAVSPEGPEILKLLFEYGAEYPKEILKESPIARAIKTKSMSCLLILLNHAYKTSTYLDGDLSPLMQAIANYVDDSIEPLLEFNGDPNFVNSKGNTALLLAIRRNSLPIVQTLVKHGASVDCREFQSGSTPVHLACDKGNLEMLKFLVDSGANIFALDAKNRPATFNTINAPSPELVVQLLEYLTEKGLDLNARDKDGTTLLLELMPDSKRALPPVIEFLLSNGAKADIKNEHGKTALDLAKAFKDPQIIELFKKYSK